MPLRHFLLILVTLALPLRAAAAAPTAEAARIIAELDLQAGAQPVSALPGWQPRRVVVIIPPTLAAALPDYEPALRKVANGVELVIDRSADFLPDRAALAGADALIGLCTPAVLEWVDSTFLWLHSYTSGMEGCTGLPQAQVAGRVFTNNRGLSSPAIAEHAIAMLLALARNLPAYGRAQAGGRWDRSPAAAPGFGEVSGKTLLVAGLGAIGRQVAQRAHGLGMRVIATRNSSREGPDYVEYVGLADELGRLAGAADVVVNALPLTAQTVGLFDRDLFARVKPGAIYISVGRGGTTVTADLVAALESGRLAGAGLDVTEPEPLPQDNALWRLPNVIITPHVSGGGRDSMRRTAAIAVENLRRYLAGDRLLNVVDLQAGY